MIHINQVGYNPKGQKIAVVANVTTPDNLFVVKDQDTNICLQGQLSEAKFDPESGDTVAYADFSALEQEGTFYLAVGDTLSPSFSIKQGALAEVGDAVLKMLYYLRCGCELHSAHAGPYAHACCHTTPAERYDKPGTFIDATGGWHDAGDYGKYAGPGAVALAHLYLAYEFLPKGTFDRPLGIPESGNGVPDILNEARYELDFLLKCVDAQTGGVFHKITSRAFPGMIMPETDDLPLVASPISATATGASCAAFAMGARIFGAFDPAYAETLAQAAHKTYGWLTQNPSVAGFKNPPEIVTGEYGDDTDTDERFWAATAMWRLTGQASYTTDLQAHYTKLDKTRLGELGWADVAGLGVLELILGEHPAMGEQALTDLRNSAQTIHEHVLAKGYFNGLASYHWGSNGAVMNHALLLTIAGELAQNTDWLASAKKMLDYLLGVNPLGISYITGFGSKQIMEPHHRPSLADGVKAPVPGMIAGGPNERRQDPPSKEFLPENLPPAKAFIDHWDSYATNEVTIYWNSPAVLPFYFFATLA